MGGSLCLRHPLQYGKQQLTAPCRFGFVKSAVLKIGSKVAGRGGGQLRLHPRAVGAQLHRQRVNSNRQMIKMGIGRQWPRCRNLCLKPRETSVTSWFSHTHVGTRTCIVCVCVSVEFIISRALPFGPQGPLTKVEEH